MSHCRSTEGRDDRWDTSDAAGRPRLRVRTVERTAVVRFEDAEIFFEEGAVHAAGRELHRLIEEEGHTRLVVNFAGVRYLSRGAGGPGRPAEGGRSGSGEHRALQPGPVAAGHAADYPSGPGVRHLWR